MLIPRDRLRSRVRVARLIVFLPLLFISPAFVNTCFFMFFHLSWRSRITFVFGLSVSLAVASTRGQVISPPFVAGFERFARHGDLSLAEAGDLLVSELSCVACHESANSQLTPKRGPTLVGTANRFSEKWLREYLNDPSEKKPGTTMPHMLGHLDDVQRQTVINKLVSFLGTQKKPFQTVRATGAVAVMHEFWNQGDPLRGRNLYHTVGCVACHQPDAKQKTNQTAPTAVDQMISQLDTDELEELGLLRAARRVASVPHGDLVGKYTRQSLTMFLLRPESVRKAARMPNLRLSPSEAADVTAYLLSEKGSEISSKETVVDPAMVSEGKALFVELQCSNCHDATDVASPRMATPWEKLNPEGKHKCWTRPAAAMPYYKLDELQVDAIKSVLKSESMTAEINAAQWVHSRMLQLNCYACHQRETELMKDGGTGVLGGVGRYRKPYFEMVQQVDLGDEGRLPPPLTGVGSKLQPKALKAVFDQRTPAYRRHMKARMPAYHATAVEALVENLPVADRAGKKSESTVFGNADESLFRAGHELSGTGCVECHYFRGESLPGVVGLDLAGITTRVRPEWFHDFVLDPGALKNRTRMPTFFPDGKSNRLDLLDGDVDKQIASLWFYLKDLASQPLPEKIEKVRSQNYELRPVDRPIVLRSFMQDAGTHAIAVGFPEGLHYSYDSEKIRLASAWKGRFIDARGTWFERFTPPAEPLGESLMHFPQGQPFATLDRKDVRWPAWEDQAKWYQFRGYRLDAQGVPTFLYQFAQWQIEERIVPMGQRGLRRQWNIKQEGINAAAPRDESVTLNLCVHQAIKLTRNSGAQVDGGGLQTRLVKLPQGVNGSGDRIIKDERGERWIVPVNGKDQQTVVVEYAW
ncbi:MAG TPA: cytochrome oxidase [Rhodopirellula sp.]|nr:cytochrome oxidase [Rhodopirellula sp.]